MNALIKRTELGDIIARSTTGVFGQLLDVGRTAVMSVDLVVQGTVTRILRRSEPSGQLRPDDPTVRTQVRSLPRIERAVALQGHYAGSPSRFLAFVIDTFLAGTLYTIGLALFTFALEVVTGITWVDDEHRLLISVAYVLWMLLYLAVPTGVAGRTIGKAVLGLFVVRSNGDRIDLRHTFLRTLAFPLSFLMFGVGFLFGLIRRDRRQLHDLIADTAVVYAWDADVARIRARTAEPHDHTIA